MAIDLGKANVRDIDPDHPFAHTCIILGGFPAPRHRPPLPIGRHGVTLSVEWGYNLYSLKIGAARWRSIRQGEAIMIRNKQWYEGKPFNCYWLFNMNSECSLVVDYGEDGGTGFNGDIRDADIEERLPCGQAA